MTEYFEKSVTRLGMNSESAMAWAKGEAKLGLNNSLFICRNGKLIQYVDSEEGLVFHEDVEKITDDKFNLICEDFFKAVKDKDLETMHIGLAIFNELDEYNLGSPHIKRRLLRVRESTENEAYTFKLGGSKDFIIYKCKLYEEPKGYN